MTLAKKLAGTTASFAHLLGLDTKARAEEEDKRKEAEEEEEKKSKKSKRAEEDAEEEADEEAEDEEANEGEEAEEDKEDKKSKKSKKAENDDKDDDGDEEEDDDKDKAKKAYRRGVKAERERCAAIFKCSAAGARPDVAAHLAFETGMSAKAAVAMLSTVAAGGPQKRGLADRMAAVKTPNVGSDAGASVDPASPKAIANQILAAAAKARGEA